MKNKTTQNQNYEQGINIRTLFNSDKEFLNEMGKAMGVKFRFEDDKEEKQMFSEKTKIKFDEIMPYQVNESLTVPVGRIGKDWWWTVSQIAKFYEVDRRTIEYHIKKILESKELQEELVCQKIWHTTQHGAIKGKTQTIEVKAYNLDMVIQIGFYVKSDRGIIFRERTRNHIKNELSEEKEQTYIQQVPLYTEFEIFNFFSNFIYLPIKTISQIIKISVRHLRYLCSTQKLESRMVHIKGEITHHYYEIAVSSLDMDSKKKIFEHLKTQNQLSLLIDKAKNIQQLLLTGNDEAINSAKMLLSNDLILKTGRGWSYAK